MHFFPLLLFFTGHKLHPLGIGVEALARQDIFKDFKYL